MNAIIIRYSLQYSMQQSIHTKGWCPVEIDSINVLSQLHLNSVLIVQYRSDVI